MSVYLAYNASAPVDGRVIDYMVEVYPHNIGTADSRTHSYGDNDRKVLEDGKKKGDRQLGVTYEKILLT